MCSDIVPALRSQQPETLSIPGKWQGNPSGNEIGGIVGKLNESQLIAVGGEIRNESSVTGATQVGGVAGRCDRNRTDSPIRAYGDIVNQGKSQLRKLTI